jgi:hypothetical protein
MDTKIKNKKQLFKWLICCLILVIILAGNLSPLYAEEPVIPIVFPVAGSATFTDTYGAPRNNARSHEGIDIMAAKMTPVLAAVDGIVDWLNDGSQNNSYLLLLRGEDGNDYLYLHLNNDTPGTDDGLGGSKYAYAPGLQNGDRVRAGEVIAYVGDSGNAEDVQPHLHFEIHLGGYKNPINPFPSLLSAIKTELFHDTLPTSWFFPYLENLFQKKIVTGYSDGTFKPYLPIKRAEFIKLVIKALNLQTELKHQGFFADVPASYWASPYIELAKLKGFIEGDTNGNFRPEDKITRAEAAKILTNSLNLTLIQSEIGFRDVPSSHWAYQYILTLKAKGIINGYPDNTFKPENPLSRGEAIKLISFLS